jgi:hypothetical protein
MRLFDRLLPSVPMTLLYLPVPWLLYYLYFLLALNLQ